MACECRRASRGGAGKVCDECERRECFEWNWEKEGSGSTVVFQNNDRNVIFNPGFSVGTAAVRGTKPFRPGYHHYWEIEMSTEVYGTDMMIGIGTEKTDLRKYSHNFVSLLGIDDQSWGLSYLGEKKHGGQSHQYSKSFGQYSIIGVHLDLWVGTLEFYIDRKPLGKAFIGLQDKILYPMISSTAARSGMNLIFCRSYPPTLQLQAMLAISQNFLSPAEEENASLFKVLSLPPGLKLWMKTNYWWIVSCRDRERKREEELNNRSKCDKKSRKQKRGIRQRRAEADDEIVDEADEAERESEVDEDAEEDEEDDEAAADDIFPDTAEASGSVPARRRRSPREQQCTQSANSASGASGDTSCMRILAATSSRAHFLGRVSPIFVGMPEGGFSVLSGAAHNSASGASPSSLATNSGGSTRTSARSRSVPAQPSSSSGVTSISRVTRQASSSEDEDSTESATSSARREPKRLRLRSSIEGKGDDDDETPDKNSSEAELKTEPAESTD